ncbi:hypothetical protein ACA086_08735, partial [Muriicola sp. E247]
FDIPITELESNGLGAYSNIQQVVIDLVNSGEAYIDNIYFYKPAGGGGGTAPTTSAPVPPTRDAGDVISIFSDSYTNVTGINYDPNWGQSGHTLVDPAYDPGDGNVALAYPNFNYQGTDFAGNAQDVSAMEFLHVDMWTANATDVKVTPINGSGAPTESLQGLMPITAGQWVQYDIPLSDFTASGMTLDQIVQMKFDGQGGTTPSDIYLDNIYFYRAAGGGTAPTTSAPVPPSRDAGDVISIFSDSYTNITGINYDPNWGQSGHTLVDPAYDPGDGNVALAYPNFNYQGTDFAGNAQDVSAMEFLHVDMWTANATDVKVTPINGSGAPTESLQGLMPITSGQWVQYDIPLSDFTASGMTLDQIVQMKFDGQGGTTPSDIYLDNIYFYRAAGSGGTAPTTSAPVPPARDAGDVISIFSDSYTNITGINYDPNWGQSGHTLVNPTYDPGDGNFALAYPNFNYQGTDFAGNAQDVSAMEFLHVDMWTPDATVVQVTPINGSGAPTESLQSLTPITTGAWNSYDIPLGDYTASGMTLDQIVQMKFDGQAGTTPSDIYLDNIYFYRAAAGGGGGNLAADGDFESGVADPWLLFANGGTAAFDNTINNGGTWSGRLATGGPSNPALKQERIGAGTVAATDVVQIQFDHIGSVVQPGAVFNVILFGEGSAGASFTHVFSPAPSLSGSWTTFTGTFTIPGGTDVSEGISFLIEAVCGGDAGCSVVANIDNVSVTLNP